MEYRKLGNSGLEVSPLSLGTMMFGDRTDEKQAARIVDSAFDAGVNFIDTADQYAKGESERITGKLIVARRDHWVLATKVGNRMGDGPNRVGLGRKWMMQAIDASLRRLGTDYVDIYYLHRDFDDALLEEAVRAMDDIIRSGKARYFGLSNFRGWRIAEIMHLCRSMNIPQPVVCQPYYNAMNRQPEVEILPACRYYGIGVVPYSPLARGALTGKYQPGAAPPAETRAGRSDKRMMETEFREESLEIAQKIKAFAETKGMGRAVRGQLGAEQLRGQRDRRSAYARQYDYRKHSVQARRQKRGAGGFHKCARHPSTPGFNDPQYPLSGRIARNG
jgi:aryl-alcohol dehydrogenase (NADP+)